MNYEQRRKIQQADKRLYEQATNCKSVDDYVEFLESIYTSGVRVRVDSIEDMETILRYVHLAQENRDKYSKK